MSRVNFKQRLEAFVTSAWYTGAGWLWLLWPLTLIVRKVVANRRQRFINHPPAVGSVPVVVVGGITVGGTGKTPLIIALVDALRRHGLTVAVVSRGYGGQISGQAQVIDEKSPASVVGDEPLVIYLRCHCTVVVGPDRVAAVRLAEQSKPNIILSDDGLQHYRMHREFEIAVLDAARGLGNGQLLPMGPLREAPDHLDTVDWILERNGKGVDSGFHYTIRGLQHRQSRQVLAAAEARTRWQTVSSIAAVTGIGQPDQFFDSIRSMGIQSNNYAFGDHYALTKKDLDAIADEVIIMTEKDAIKLGTVVDERVWVLTIDASLPESLLTKLLSLFLDDNEGLCTES